MVRNMWIEDLPFRTKAILGKTTLPIFAYSDLKIGDIILLDQRTEETISITVDKEDFYRGSLGLFRSHKAVTIDERIHS